MTRPLALTVADLCDDALCALVRGHEGRHDPPFDSPETEADRASRSAEEARAQQLAEARARPITHVTVGIAEQGSLFG